MKISTARSSFFLNLALLITYFGDYCSLIGLMEYAKHFGSSDKVLSIFIVYCFPPLIMSLIANKWAQNQKHPEKQMALFSILGAISGLSLLHTISYWHVLLVTLILGFVKEGTQLLVNVFIKFNFTEEDSKRVVNNIVTTRFFIMVFGGSLGGYLGGINRFDLVFIIDAATFLIAGIIFYLLNTQAHLMQQAKTLSLSFWKGNHDMISTFGLHPFVWVILAGLGIGSFMGLEYPLITTEFDIAPKLIGVIYFWHVLGALLARKFGKTMLNKPNLVQTIIFYNFLLIVSFGLVGLFGKGLLLVGLQIGIIAFLMVLTEVCASFYLMKQSSKEVYPFYNLYYRVANRFSLLVGSIVPLVMFGYFSLFATNMIFNIQLLVLGGFFFLLSIVYRKEEKNEMV